MSPSIRRQTSVLVPGLACLAGGRKSAFGVARLVESSAHVRWGDDRITLDGGSGTRTNYPSQLDPRKKV